MRQALEALVLVFFLLLTVVVLNELGHTKTAVYSAITKGE